MQGSARQVRALERVQAVMLMSGAPQTMLVPVPISGPRLAKRTEKPEENPRGSAIAGAVIVGGGTTTVTAVLEKLLTDEIVKGVIEANAGKSDDEIRKAIQTALLGLGLGKLGVGALVAGLTAWGVKNPWAAWLGYGAGFGTMASGGLDLVEWNKLNPKA